jgi:DNA-binding response OmpR family regulator
MGVIGSRPARACRVGDWAVAREPSLRQTSASKRQAITRRDTGAVAAVGINVELDGMAAASSSDLTLRTNGDRQVCVLVVEDDPALQRMILDYFGENNIRTLPACDRRDMVDQLGRTEVNLVILDLRLGREDGLDLLREIRSSSDVPVIIITGHSRDDIDRIVGLELGADDYLTKPFNLRELLARVRAILRRFDAGRAAPARDPKGGRFRFCGWQLDSRTRRLTDPAGGPVPLTKGEYALLMAFIDAPQRPLSREHLLQATRVHEDVFDRSIDVQILRLRRKLEQDPSAPRVIQTERGVGYVFAVPIERL